MNEPTDSDDFSELENIINAGSNISGSALGAGLGFILGGTGGAATGSAIGTAASIAFRNIGQEISLRMLSPREEQRVGGVIAIAAAKIKDRTRFGEKLRDDNFFDTPTAVNSRNPAEEIMEETLYKAQRESEEKKVIYLANFLSNIVFDKSVSKNLSHQILKSFETLTYRQLCILKIAATKNKYNLRESDYRNQGRFQKSLYEVLYECKDLYNRSYINFSGEVLFGPTDVLPSNIKIQGVGGDIYNLMELKNLPEEDLNEIVDILS